MRRMVPFLTVALWLCAPPAYTLYTGPVAQEEPRAGTPGGPGLAVRAAKILSLARDGEMVIDNGVLLIKDGKIAGLGPVLEVDVPAGYEELDVGEQWLMPGLVELHCHVGSPNLGDLGDVVYLTNPGLRVNSAVRPNNQRFQVGIAGGVTAALYIPGSGSNMGGQGVMLKTGHRGYEQMELNQPGSLKLAQAGNPESWTVGVSRSFMNWNIRNTFERGVAYAKQWEAFEAGERSRPEKNPQFEVFRALRKNDAQVSTHTQFGQVVMMTVLMVAKELGLPVYIDHGSFGGYEYAEFAQEQGVSAILGPRMTAFSLLYSTWDNYDTGGRVLGIAAEYQARGHTMIGFNTDCVDGTGLLIGTPPQEELSLQAAMALRFGLTNFNLESLRGLTIIPAVTAGLGDRIGSLEVGKDADFLILDGDVADPRTTIKRVYTDGKLVYDQENGRLW